MAKKRKAARNAAPSGPKEVDTADARLNVNTFEDVADSEDEYFINRDRIMLGDEPDSKRRRKDDDIELSDEEVLAYDDDNDEDSESDADAKKSTKEVRGKRKTQDQDDDEDEEEDEDQEGWWGSSKQEYYDADNIETEADALEEEAEAKRLQQKKLSKMTDEDFIFDGDEWAAAELPSGDDQDEPVIEVLKDIEITEDMGPEERYAMLRSRYPELEPLISEFHEQKLLLEQLKASTVSNPGHSIEASKPAQSIVAIKYWVLGCYVASLASYFAIFTSPARDTTKESKPLDPSELRDHEIMQTLLECREAWRKIKGLKSLALGMESEPDVADVTFIERDVPVPKAEKTTKKTRKSNKNEKEIAEKQAKKLARAKAAEASVADLYNLPLTTSTMRTKTEASNEDSDFGEETTLDARTAAEKAARKKTLKFYTSQIAQKANKRADAGRDAGGDADLPYRERLRDRQARLLAQAEKRGQRTSKHGAELGGDSDEDDTAAASAMRNDENEYYDMVAHQAKSNKDDKAARYTAYAAASKADRVVPVEQLGEDGKRKISYAIEKNKGLTPKRSKDVRNPRVKKRKQYEAKMKKLASMKPVYKGGEPKGGYRGELTGINSTVVRNVRL